MVRKQGEINSDEPELHDTDRAPTEHTFDGRLFALWVSTFVLVFTLSRYFPTYEIFDIPNIGGNRHILEIVPTIVFQAMVAWAGGMLLGFLQYLILSYLWPISRRYIWRTALGVVAGWIVVLAVFFPVQVYLGSNLNDLSPGVRDFLINHIFPLLSALDLAVAGLILAWSQWPGLADRLYSKRGWLIGLSLGYLMQALLPILFSRGFYFLWPMVELPLPIFGWVGYLMPGIISGLAIHAQLHPEEPRFAPIQAENSRSFFLLLAGSLLFVWASSSLSEPIATLFEEVPAAIELEYDSPLVADGQTESIVRARVLTAEGKPVSGVTVSFYLHEGIVRSGETQQIPPELIPADGSVITITVPVTALPYDPLVFSISDAGCLLGGEMIRPADGAGNEPVCPYMDVVTTDADGYAEITYRTSKIDEPDNPQTVFIRVTLWLPGEDVGDLFAEAEIHLTTGE